ncbi:MAG TPA: cytochrome c [Haliangium sp.]|nr:cytochrome c [Haliangium sp.]
MMSRLHPASLHGWRVLALAGLAAVCLTGCPVEEPIGPDAAPADTFTMLYQTIGSTCAGCHAPGAVGAPVGTEATQDWSSVASARSSLRGMATGLMGNFEACNGVPLLGDTPETSLLVAALDEQVRADFSLADFPDCNADAISDMTLKIGRPLSAAERSLLTQFVMEEAAGQ